MRVGVEVVDSDGGMYVAYLVSSQELLYVE
jgi:hypothetical protein